MASCRHEVIQISCMVVHVFPCHGGFCGHAWWSMTTWHEVFGMSIIVPFSSNISMTFVQSVSILTCFCLMLVWVRADMVHFFLLAALCMNVIFGAGKRTKVVTCTLLVLSPCDFDMFIWPLFAPGTLTSESSGGIHIHGSAVSDDDRSKQNAAACVLSWGQMVAFKGRCCIFVKKCCLVSNKFFRPSSLWGF